MLAITAAAQDTAFYQNAEWAPDGKKIAAEVIIRSGKNFSFNSYIIDIATGGVEKKIANTVFPRWSPDGKYIAYSKMTGIKFNSDVWMMNVATGDTIQVTNVPSRNIGVSFSPDGKRICFSSDRGGNLNLYVTGIDGSNLQKITTDTFKYYNAVWSPKGDDIVYYRERGDNRDKVFMLNIKDGKEIKVTNDTLHDIYPGWLPNGKTIIYTFANPAVNNGDVRQIAVIDANGNNKHVIPGSAGAFFARVSADGKKIAFTKGVWPQDNIYIANIDGSNMQCVTCAGIKL
jgi:TolB protein